MPFISDVDGGTVSASRVAELSVMGLLLLPKGTTVTRVATETLWKAALGERCETGGKRNKTFSLICLFDHSY